MAGGTSKIRVLKVQSGGPQNTKKYNREVNDDTLDKVKIPQNRLGLAKSLILLVPLGLSPWGTLSNFNFLFH
jgi:hypothetical protein